MSMCRGGGEEKKEGHVRTFWRWFKRCPTKVPPGLRATYVTVVLTSAVVVGQLPSILAATVVAATAILSCSYSTIAASIIQATSAVYISRIPMLQLREN
jgi:hypothetical protein